MEGIDRVAERIPARLSRGEARRFGLVVGSAFLVLGTLAWWRGRPLASQVFWVVGAALILFGMVLPAALRPVHRAWMGLALTISKVTTPIFLGIVYFGIITPVGLVRRVLGQDPLKRKRTGDTFWVPLKAGQKQSDMKRQF
jgi:saxitoxin biosynthesis operon SxtJ-like protein